MRFGLYAGALVACLLVGCASAPPLPVPLRASPEADQEGKAFRARRDQAQVFVYRNTRFGSEALMSLAVDGRPMGSMGGRSYMLLALTPGLHLLEARNGDNRAELEMNLQAGRNYFVQLNFAIALEIGKMEMIERHALEAQYAIQNDTSRVLPRLLP